MKAFPAPSVHVKNQEVDRRSCVKADEREAEWEWEWASWEQAGSSMSQVKVSWQVSCGRYCTSTWDVDADGIHPRMGVVSPSVGVIVPKRPFTRVCRVLGFLEDANECWFE